MSKPVVHQPEPDPASTAPDPGTKPPALSKLQTIIMLLERPQGALLEELVAATSWQKHSVRGAISGALKYKRHLPVSSTLVEGRGRVYRIVMPEGAAMALPDLGHTAEGLS